MGLLSRIFGRRTVDLDERGPETGVKLKDMLVLEQLVHAGADLTAPRHVVYYLYFEDQTDAHDAAGEAQSRAFETDVQQVDDLAQWSLRCERHDYVLSLDDVRDNTDFFEDLADRLVGDFDGWEASLV